MKDGHPRRSSNFASCVVGTIFVAFIIMIMLILFFSVFKAKDPKITVNAVQVPNFHVSAAATDLNPINEESTGTVNFTISVYLTVKNPNRGTFNYYDSSLELNSGGDQIGFMFLPAGRVMSQSSQLMALTLSVKPFPAAAAINPDNSIGEVVAISTKLKMGGRVRVLHFFTHHVQASALCDIRIAVDDGSVTSFHCTGP